MKGYARELTSVVESGKWLPHHVATTKQMAFDLSAKLHGIIISKALLSVSDLTNQVFGVLQRFKEEQIKVLVILKQFIAKWEYQKIWDALYGSFGGRTETPRNLLLIMKWQLKYFMSHHHYLVQNMLQRKLQQIMSINMGKRCYLSWEGIYV